jgi:hypothetical protein
MPTSKVTRNCRQCREEQVAEGVADEVIRGANSMLQHLAEWRIRIREGTEAVANVAWGQHPEFFSEPPGTAAIIGNRDDGGHSVSRQRP